MSAPAATIERETSLERWVWTCDEFMRVAETGFFDERDAELIKGELYPIETPSPLHSCLSGLIVDRIMPVFGTGFFARTCQPLVLDSISQPRPDMYLCAGMNTAYRRQFPKAASVRLIIEISDSSEARDKLVKLPAYANAGIPEYWILNLRDLCLGVFREPVSGNYVWNKVYRPGEAVAPLHAPEGRTVSVAELLGE